MATGRVGAQTELLVVDGIVSGMHEPGTSHYELLRAFQEDDVLETMATEAEDHDYRSHEFGDAVFIERFASVGAERLEMWDTWTSIASQPVAFEAPSAGFILDWSTLRALRARGVRLASITHAAGISSTGDPELDRLLPLDEPYVIPAATAALVNRTKQCGGRVLAIGTTVVRALEHAARRTGHVRSGGGVATGRIGAQTGLLIVDGIVSGMHEPGTSHYELLGAFQEGDTLETMAAEAEDHDYRSHEFGDAVFMERFAGVDAEQLVTARKGPLSRLAPGCSPLATDRQQQGASSGDLQVATDATVRTCTDGVSRCTHSANCH